MEEGTKTKKTVFVGGIGDDVDEAVLIETFSTFGQEPFVYTSGMPLTVLRRRHHRGAGTTRTDKSIAAGW